MSETSKSIMRIVMRTIFGTDAACAREAEREVSNDILAKTEKKMILLDQQLDKRLGQEQRRAQSLNEAVDQVSGSER